VSNGENGIEIARSPNAGASHSPKAWPTDQKRVASNSRMTSPTPSIHGRALARWPVAPAQPMPTTSRGGRVSA
jgi:hypothetical protein